MADLMNNNGEMRIIEECRVAAPQGSVPSTALPFTFFDIPWLICHPVKRIFFYHFPHSTNHFLQSTLPSLKHSLSLTLQHFFPFSSNLIVPPQPCEPFILYQPGTDSLSFTIAESNADFGLLLSDSPQDVTDWNPFIQVTVLPNSGFIVSLTFSHAAADGNSLHHFMKFWANCCKAIVTNGEAFNNNVAIPFHDRSIVKDPNGLKKIYLGEIKDLIPLSMEFLVKQVSSISNKARATLVLSRDNVEDLKKWVSLNSSESLQHISTFVVTSSLIWVSMIQLEQQIKDNNDDDELCHFGFLADCRGHPKLSIPLTYFGNCLMLGFVTLKRSEIVGENGIIKVANEILREVRVLKDGENLMERKELGKPGKTVLVVAGSPRLRVYETDFGWGNPKKSEGFVDVESSVLEFKNRERIDAVY